MEEHSSLLDEWDQKSQNNQQISMSKKWPSLLCCVSIFGSAEAVRNASDASLGAKPLYGHLNLSSCYFQKGKESKMWVGLRGSLLGPIACLLLIFASLFSPPAPTHQILLVGTFSDAALKLV
jgi:hypothetical protein